MRAVGVLGGSTTTARGMTGMTRRMSWSLARAMRVGIDLSRRSDGGLALPHRYLDARATLEVDAASPREAGHVRLPGEVADVVSGSDETQARHRGSSTETVMRFVTLASEGGPHDDDSYLAGWECGGIDHRLQLCAAAFAEPLPMLVRTTNLAQIDLLATRYGFTVDHVEHTSVWSTVTFRFQKEERRESD